MRQLTLLGLTALALLISGPVVLGQDGKPEREKRAKKPNILVIITDDQNANMLSCAGNPHLKTPAMDSLAATGMRFARAYCAEPLCQPSRFSLLTGVMPSRFGVGNSGVKKPVDPEIVRNSLGNLFRLLGYRTVFGGKTHFAMRFDDSGFEDLSKVTKGGGTLEQRCAMFLRQPQEQPFLLVASFNNPHDICFMAIHSHAESEGKKVKYGKALSQAMTLPMGMTREQFLATVCPPLPNNFEPQEGEPKAILAPDNRPFRSYVRKRWTEEQWRLYRWAYARLTESVDAEIAQVLHALRDAGLEEDTVVVFLGDHGSMDASHRLEHKSVLYEESARAPLIVSWKGVTKPGAVDQEHLVSTGLDLIPTLCDFAGVPAPKDLKGRSLRALAEGRKVESWRETLVVETQAEVRMLCSARYKYVTYPNREEQLVDLETDPGEMRNLAQDPKLESVLVEHRRLLKEWYRENGETWSPK
jgi:choline-sulfatase